MLVMVAAVATEEPLIAAKPAQAVTVAMASPPRRWPSQAFEARNSSRLMPDAVANDPIRMNIGITARSQSVETRIGDWARRLSAGLRSEEHTSELQSRQYLVCRL